MYADIVSGKIEEAEIRFGSIYFFVAGEDRCQTHKAEMSLVGGQFDGQHQDDQAAELGCARQWRQLQHLYCAAYRK